MRKIIATKDFIMNGVSYIEGDELDVKDIRLIRRLNELGFIESLSYKDLVLLERELVKEDKYDTREY